MEAAKASSMKKAETARKYVQSTFVKDRNLKKLRLINKVYKLPSVATTVIYPYENGSLIPQLV